MDDPNRYNERSRSHILIDLFRDTSAYISPPRRLNRKPIRADYSIHAARLIEQIVPALGSVPSKNADIRASLSGLKAGTIIEVTTVAPARGSRMKAVKIPTVLDFPSRDVVVLRSKRNENCTETALLFVPDDARAFLKDRIVKYGRDGVGRDRPDVDRFEVIEDIRAIDVISLFTNDVDLQSRDIVWWEIWVRRPIVSADQVAQLARSANIDVHSDRLLFPDTTILFLHAAASTLCAFAMSVPGAITEIRKATGTIEPFLERGSSGTEQSQWVSELSSRIESSADGSNVVCILDTGVASAHPLIAPGLYGAWALDENWGADDHYPDGGHGTALAGLVLYGDLEPIINDSRRVILTHGTESMKLLAPRGFAATKPPSYGMVTQAAVGLVEVKRPNVVRSFCLATSTTDFLPSRPSSWSGAIDQIAAGSMLGDLVDGLPASSHPKRLVMVATGNISGGLAVEVLPTQSLEDPSQSWNALTIGGFTRKEQISTASTLQPAVPGNHRSPYSRGSQALSSDLTPIKPEVLFEAGNMSSDQSGFCAWDPAMSLLATGSNHETEPFVPFWATSAATGMAGHFLGQLQAAHPDLWPETHRALVVDSARWPTPIRRKFIGTGAHWKTGTKADQQKNLREFGYGVPDIERAIFSAQNDATLIAQTEIQPYALGLDRKTGVFNEMHFYDLPWPKHVLEALENEIVMMKITLSYFIEPNLNGKAATRPDTYRSFGLRFDMKKRGESDTRFRSRITASQQKEGTDSEPESSYWLLGPKAVQAGSLHCDIWRGHAVDLAAHDAIAIYPVGGWWKSHIGQKRVTDKARYSLVISISASGQNVDLYSEIEALVDAKEIEVLLG